MQAVLHILYSFISDVALGGILGLGLAFASRVLAVKKDKKIEEIEGILPGLNCGACGYAGCSGYAEAVALEGEVLTLCTPGGAEVATKLGEAMGVEVDTSGEKQVTQVHCQGGPETAKYDFDYTGIEDCNALYLLYKGNKQCKYGCLGLGSCIRVCPVNAIDYDKDGLVKVDKEKCISCGKCVKVCPTGVMRWVPYSADYIVACNSPEKGAVVKKYCSVGCIGCRLCAKKSPDGGFEFDRHLALINYEATGDRSEAAKKCPPKCIIQPTGGTEKGKEQVETGPVAETKEQD